MAASCELTLGDGTEKQYVLTDECICETMYVSENLVQRPGSEFLAIGSSEEFMFLKDRGGAGPDLREAHRVGEVTSTHDGKGTTIERINIAMAHFPKAHLLESDEQICAAVLGNRPINVRTRYTDPAEKTQVVMNYPVRCSNSASKQQRWQIDTGRVLTLARGAGNGLRDAADPYKA